MDEVESLPQLIHTLTLPTLTLVAFMTAYSVRMMQASLLQVMESEYVRTATLKGLTRGQVILRHALPNAVGPALRVTTLNIAWLIGGVVLVETVFNFPGLGRLLVMSVRVLDTPVILAVTLILSGVYVFTNLGADIISALLNPRLRAG
jgi:peptide/nickel transport system permease protein